jgi:hypothetical protein
MAASKSRFNGFYSYSQVEIADESTVTGPIRRRSRSASHLKLVKNDQSVEQ